MTKILLLEGDDAVAEIYENKFKESGFEIVRVQTAEKTLEEAAKESFELILLDINTLGEDGAKIISEIKSKEKNHSELKVILLNSLGTVGQRKEFKEAGADEFIDKEQFNPTKLPGEIQRFLNEFSEHRKNQQRANGEISNRPKGRRILFIEDEEIFLEMFGKKLEDEGYAVDYAKNGAWGMKMAEDNDYELFITDMVMPAMAGDEIIRRIKLADKTKNIPIIVLSASLIEEDIQPVREMGIEDFYEKTRLVPSDLARRVEEILG